MVISVTPDLESALIDQAKRQGTEPEALALQSLRELFLPSQKPRLSHEEFVKRLHEMGRDYGVSLPNSALSSEGIYE